MIYEEDLGMNLAKMQRPPLCTIILLVVGVIAIVIGGLFGIWAVEGLWSSKFIGAGAILIALGALAITLGIFIYSSEKQEEIMGKLEEISEKLEDGKQ